VFDIIKPDEAKILYSRGAFEFHWYRFGSWGIDFFSKCCSGAALTGGKGSGVREDQLMGQGDYGWHEKEALLRMVDRRGDQHHLHVRLRHLAL
jgi:hypothetical protein